MTSDGLIVFVRDGWSRVVRPAESHDLGADGWLPVGRVSDRAEGWALAAVAHGALPADYDNPLRARPITLPATLYRSVSLEELGHILETGSVRGGGNGFNGFDRRPFVFFADRITPKVIAQGEDDGRALAYPYQGRMAELADAELRYLRELATIARDRFEALRANPGSPKMARRIASIQQPIDWDSFPDGNSAAYRDSKWLGLLPEEEFSRRLRDFSSARARLRDELDENFHGKVSERKAEKEALTFSSALIETKPIGLGFHFSKSFGGSGMGEEDEYGLFPGQVRIQDIKSVLWVKNGTVVDETSCDAASEVMERLDLERTEYHASLACLAPTP